MKQRILVLGANGFVGRHVVSTLAAGNWAEPIAAVRRPSPADGISRLVFDATNAEGVRNALEGIDGVVNCISGDAQTIVASANALFESAARQPNKPRIVHLSSMAVYGAATGILSESAPLSSDSPYSAAKIATEKLAAKFGGAVILRPGIVYGPGSAQWTTRIAHWLESRRIGDLGPRGDGYCNLVYIADLVAAISESLQRPNLSGAIFNLSLPTPPTWNEYFTSFGRALGAVPVRRITNRRLKIESKLLAPPLKVAEILAAKLHVRVRLPPAMPPSLLRLYEQDLRLEVTRAEEILGQRWTPIEQALALSAQWYQRHLVISA